MGYVSSVNTKVRSSFRSIADGSRSTMTEDIVYLFDERLN